jgi:hypothetical protein
MNKEGKKPLSLAEDSRAKEVERPKDMLYGSDLTRFDKAKKKKKKKKNRPAPDPQQEHKNNAKQQGEG